MAFVADWRLVANFWLRPGNAASSINFESFIATTLDNLGQTRVGLLRADNLMSVFRRAVLRPKVQHTLSTLHHHVLAEGAMWEDSIKNTRQTFRLAVARKRRAWFEGL